jgi:hypothetical protein
VIGRDVRLSGRARRRGLFVVAAAAGEVSTSRQGSRATARCDEPSQLPAIVARSSDVCRLLSLAPGFPPPIFVLSSVRSDVCRLLSLAPGAESKKVLRSGRIVPAPPSQQLANRGRPIPLRDAEPARAHRHEPGCPARHPPP